MTLEYHIKCHLSSAPPKSAATQKAPTGAFYQSVKTCGVVKLSDPDTTSRGWITTTYTIVRPDEASDVLIYAVSSMVKAGA